MSARAPFPAGPNVAAYVPNSEIEESLAYLAAKLLEAPGWVGMCGPPGVGKTLALRLLLQRWSERFTPLYVPTAGLTPAECERWITAQLGAGDASVADAARRVAAAGRPLLVGLDEAQLATPALVAALDVWCAAETQARAVLAWTEDEDAGRPAALARCAARVFIDPLELAQVPAYVDAHLRHAGADDGARAALSGRTLERIALASGGNPRRIQRLADAELAAHAWRARRSEARTAAPPAAPRATESAPRGAPEPAPPAPAAPRCRRALALAAGAAALLAACAWLALR